MKVLVISPSGDRELANDGAINTPPVTELGDSFGDYYQPP